MEIVYLYDDVVSFWKYCTEKNCLYNPSLLSQISCFREFKKKLNSVGACILFEQKGYPSLPYWCQKNIKFDVWMEDKVTVVVFVGII